MHFPFPSKRVLFLKSMESEDIAANQVLWDMSTMYKNAENSTKVLTCRTLISPYILFSYLPPPSLWIATALITEISRINDITGPIAYT